MKQAEKEKIIDAFESYKDNAYSGFFELLGQIEGIVKFDKSYPGGLVDKQFIIDNLQRIVDEWQEQADKWREGL